MPPGSLCLLWKSMSLGSIGHLMGNESPSPGVWERRDRCLTCTMISTSRLLRRERHERLCLSRDSPAIPSGHRMEDGSHFTHKMETSDGSGARGWAFTTPQRVR